jgi:hypothetical protein
VLDYRIFTSRQASTQKDIAKWPKWRARRHRIKATLKNFTSHVNKRHIGFDHEYTTPTNSLKGSIWYFSNCATEDVLVQTRQELAESESGKSVGSVENKRPDI